MVTIPIPVSQQGPRYYDRFEKCTRAPTFTTGFTRFFDAVRDRTYALVIATIVITVAFSAGCQSSSVVAKARVGTSETSSTSKARLQTIAESEAASTGSRIKAATAVQTTYQRARQLLNLSGIDGDQDDLAVWLVQVSGTRPFSCECAVVPGQQSGSNKANYLLLIVDSTSFSIVRDGLLYNERQGIEVLGHVLRVAES